MSLEPLLVDPKIEKVAPINNSATRRRQALTQVALESSTSDNLDTTSLSIDSSPEEEMDEILMVMVEVVKYALWKIMQRSHAISTSIVLLDRPSIPHIWR